uniref:Uncharacterized protein n=1 Tax=Daphnia galeata TaxID=27404 RepID=A0A8J2WHB4_9CRUS|nr:unnamed protein product [Daphnia galeata]
MRNDYCHIVKENLRGCALTREDHRDNENTDHESVDFSEKMKNIKIIAVSLIVFTFLFHIQIKEFRLPIYDSYFKYHLPVKLGNDYYYSFKSTCSSTVDKRGPNQRVIAYSLYGNFSREDVFDKYVSPLKRTISLIPLIYPGWTVRIYHNLTSSEDLKIFSEDFHVDLCNATEIIQMRNLGDLFAMTWRWLPLLDDLVDTVMSRDADSAIISREKEAVTEWLASNKSFHIMRDHPAHCFFGYIMGCCWGVKVSQDRSSIVLSG